MTNHDHKFATGQSEPSHPANDAFAQFDDFQDIAAFQTSGTDSQNSPVVFNSPHSGSRYPDRFKALSRLDEHYIRVSEDMDVDALFAGVVEAGAVLQFANFPRAYLDVNREPYELDANMFSAPLPKFANTRSLRVNGGLGTVARIVAENREIYNSKLDPNDALARIELVYRPYHDQLRHLLARTHARYGQALLVDCHSMPSQHSSVKSSKDSEFRPDIIIGDRYGTSCHSELIDHMVTLFREAGLDVVKNRPYAGGFITEHYGRPQRGLNAVQIEINRRLYMNEARLVRHSGFDALQQILTDFAVKLIAHPYLQMSEDHNGSALAAE
ncbi:MAG: N-formylglutamate amidohydrolase [Hyphomicrobiales bacterium]